MHLKSCNFTAAQLQANYLEYKDSTLDSQNTSHTLNRSPLLTVSDLLTAGLDVRDLPLGTTAQVSRLWVRKKPLVPQGSFGPGWLLLGHETTREYSGFVFLRGAQGMEKTVLHGGQEYGLGARRSCTAPVDLTSTNLALLSHS